MSELHFDFPIRKGDDHRLEKSITKRCLKWAQKIPCSKWYKRKGGETNKGEPDISGCVQGIRFEIEIKTPGNKPTDLQDFKIKEWKAAGAISGWADSEEKFITIVKEGYDKLRKDGI